VTSVFERGRQNLARTHTRVTFLSSLSSRARRNPARLVAVISALFLVSIPTLWIFLASLKTRDELYRLPIQIFPSSITGINYRRAWEQVPFARFFLNSIGTTLITTVIKVALGVSTAYALSFLKFPGRKLIFWFVVGSLMVPFEVVLIPNYVTIANLGWLNTWAGIIVPGAGVAFGAFLLYQSFETLPVEIIEAARLDGVGRLGMLTRIVAPMSKPAIAAFALITAVAKWNEYLWPRLVTTRDINTTLPVGLTLLRDSEGVNEYGPIMAGAVLVALPVIPLLLFAHRRLVDGLTGGVKG
jgi:sn-glycerol 3-phosphate transport system permease protein